MEYGGGGAKPHLRIDALAQRVRFTNHKASIVPEFRRVERAEHGRALLQQLEQALEAADAERFDLGINEQLGTAGVYVAIERPAKLTLEKLQLKRQQLLVAAVTAAPARAGEMQERVAYFIPDDQRGPIQEQIAEYRDSEGANKPNAVHKRFETVEAIEFDGLRSLWTSTRPLPLDEQPAWFELWLRRKLGKNEPDAESWIDERAEPLGLHLSEERLNFPEIVVRFVHSTGRGIRRLIRELGNRCVFAWNKDPSFGVICIQSGPRG